MPEDIQHFQIRGLYVIRPMGDSNTDALFNNIHCTAIEGTGWCKHCTGAMTHRCDKTFFARRARTRSCNALGGGQRRRPTPAASSMYTCTCVNLNIKHQCACHASMLMHQRGYICFALWERSGVCVFDLSTCTVQFAVLCSLCLVWFYVLKCHAHRTWLRLRRDHVCRGLLGLAHVAAPCSLSSRRVGVCMVHSIGDASCTSVVARQPDLWQGLGIGPCGHVSQCAAISQSRGLSRSHCVRARRAHSRLLVFDKGAGLPHGFWPMLFTPCSSARRLVYRVLVSAHCQHRSPCWLGLVDCWYLGHCWYPGRAWDRASVSHVIDGRSGATPCEWQWACCRWPRRVVNR